MGYNAEGPITAETRYQLWSLQPFWNDLTSIGALITGATLLLSFTGFDSLSSLAGRNQRILERLYLKAIFPDCIICRYCNFIISTYFMQIYFPMILKLILRMSPQPNLTFCCWWVVHYSSPMCLPLRL